MRLPVVSGFADGAQMERIHPAIRISLQEHLYARFSQQHQLFETAFHATTGQHPYAVVRLELGAPSLPEPAAPDLFADAFRWHEKFLSPCSRATAFADQRT